MATSDSKPSQGTPATQEETHAVLSSVDLHKYPATHTEINDDEWDFVIVGAGPAGLMLAASLARFGGHKILVVDERSEPTTAGRADGVQPRTIEVLRNMEPLGTEFVQRSSASFERTFWDPKADGSRGIERTRRVQSFPAGMEIQDNCTLGIQQGLIEGAFLRDMDRHGLRVTRPWGFKNFVLDNSPTHPVAVTLQKFLPTVDTVNQSGQPTSAPLKPTGEVKEVRTKFLIGCDGGRSSVRAVMEREHGVTMTGDWVDTLWSALDCVVETDFPDVRKIAAIHSRNHGALYIFPREETPDGKPIIRAYTQVNYLEGKKSNESALTARDKITKEMVQKAIQEIAYPYKFEFKQVEWFTAYPIGQRIVSRYSNLGSEGKFPAHHVFLAGDACHTHSPKAGQGMNTAVIDAHALAWRFNLVQKGMANHDALLGSYHDERWKVGRQLIDFDAEYAALFSGEIPKSQPHLINMSEEERREHFIHVQRRNAAFTTGAGVVYHDGLLNYRDPRPLGLPGPVTKYLEPGARLEPAWVTRFVNSEPVRIIHEIQYDAPGGFRIYVCTGDLELNARKLEELAAAWSGPQSFLNRFTSNRTIGYNKKPPQLNTGLMGGFGTEVNPMFHILTVVKQSRFRFELEDLKHLGPLRAMVYADDEERGGRAIGREDGDFTVGGLHRKWGLDNGGIVVCRPDGYVGVVAPLDKTGVEAIERYFDAFLTEAKGRSRL